MFSKFTTNQLKGARKAIKQALSGCYQGEFRAAYLLGTIQHKVALEMAAENEPQIWAGLIVEDKPGVKYQKFGPAQDTFFYRGFKWRK